MNIFVGTENSGKINAIKKIYPNDDVRKVSSESQVSEQPIGRNETLLGAINRAKNILKSGEFQKMTEQFQSKKYKLIGIESGIVQNIMNKSYYEITYVVIMDYLDKEEIGRQIKITEPLYIPYEYEMIVNKAILKQKKTTFGKLLCEYLVNMKPKLSDDNWQKDICKKDRYDLIYEAVV
jgi:non-canonical (house-cleaning) NTP pyrophosphatase